MLVVGGHQSPQLCQGFPQQSLRMFWDPAGGSEEEQQAKPERPLNGSLERQVVQDSPTVSLAEVLQVSSILLIIFSHTSRCLEAKVYLYSQ